ncbi:MAG: hypothetical protein [Caudoviricetes sp.]|nr:MAG: hypothetical protein [Caudoviricetes sp.]
MIKYLLKEIVQLKNYHKENMGISFAAKEILNKDPFKYIRYDNVDGNTFLDYLTVSLVKLVYANHIRALDTFGDYRNIDKALENIGDILKCCLTPNQEDRLIRDIKNYLKYTPKESLQEELDNILYAFELNEIFNASIINKIKLINRSQHDTR